MDWSESSLSVIIIESTNIKDWWFDSKAKGRGAFEVAESEAPAEAGSGEKANPDLELKKPPNSKKNNNNQRTAT